LLYSSLAFAISKSVCLKPSKPNPVGAANDILGFTMSSAKFTIPSVIAPNAVTALEANLDTPPANAVFFI